MKDKIDRLYKNYFNMLIPLREVQHNKNGDLVKTTFPLFPKYIFLQNEIKVTIIFINKMKQKAKVSVKLFNREVDTILGLK